MRKRAGGAAVAWLAVAAGQLDAALVLGVEKMSVDRERIPEIQSNMSCVLDWEFDGVHGLNGPSHFVLFAYRHMHEHGTMRE